MKLSALRRCFEGLVPSFVATCSGDGAPNMSVISHVQYVDERHVALSHQFFNKTRANLLANPRASVEVIDPDTSEMYRLTLRYDHEETSGPLFEAMRLRIDAIASQAGMECVFRLIAADVFEVEAVEAIAGTVLPDALPPAPYRHPERASPSMCGLRTLSERIVHSADLEHLMSAVLEVMEGLFGFRHSMVLLADETGTRLTTVASRGYPESGAGAEVKIGEGIIGTVARARRLLRFSSVDRQMRYARAVGEGSLEIPLPGLPDVEGQLAVPLVVGDELVGVLAVESPRPLEFGPDEEDFLTIVANQVALALRAMIERPDELDEAAAPSPARAVARGARRRRQFCFYAGDDCVFVDGQYLIRNVPGRILWKLLRSHAREGRQEFSNRELRLDPGLGLPAIKDNLESRLILLRRRLAEKCPDVRLVPTSRGRFALEMDCDVELVEKAFA
jgi:GAF domain-containing protein/pyridoxamine 5'-phosphate oxidase-like protein